MDAKERVYSQSLIKRLKIQSPIPFEAGRKAGIREVVDRYKKDNPGLYKKYQAYWNNLEKEWGID